MARVSTYLNFQRNTESLWFPSASDSRRFLLSTNGAAMAATGRTFW